MARILVLEPPAPLAGLASVAAAIRGDDVATVTSAADASSHCDRHRPDLVVLPVEHPEGAALLRHLSSRPQPRPNLLALTPSNLVSAIRTWGVPESSILAAPFTPGDFEQRLGTLLNSDRRSVIRIGSLELDGSNYTVRYGRDQVELTFTEFELLRYLMQREGQVVSKIQLLNDLWSIEDVRRVNLVETYVSYVRRKVLPRGSDPMIETVRGAGYRLRRPTYRFTN